MLIACGNLRWCCTSSGSVFVCVCFGVRPYLLGTRSSPVCMLVYGMCVFRCLYVYVFVYLSACLCVACVYTPEKDRKGAEKGGIV